MNDKKVIRIGSNPAAEKPKAPLTPADLVRHAEAIIRFDRDVALRSQEGLKDLVAASQDQRGDTPTPTSSLEILCGSSSAVKVKSNVEAPPNIVSFTTRKKD